MLFAASAGAQTAAAPRQQQAVQQEVRDAHGLTPLMAAASAGQADMVKALLAAGAGVNATAADGRTALIAAVERNQIQVAGILIAAGANLELGARFVGTPLNIAENAGEAKIAALLQAAGAHSTGKSVGDTVCVRSWGGEGFCGTVKTFSIRAVQMQLTRVVGCAQGCAAQQECSASLAVGGAHGLQEGDAVEVPSWCLTETGVKQ